MASFTTTKVTLDEIAGRVNNNIKRVNASRKFLQDAVTDLTGMTAEFSGFVTQLNSDAAANPTDVAWQTAKAEKDQLVADFQALKIEAENLLAAIDAV